MEVHDRVALVRGTSGGLGTVTAYLLAAEGAHVALTHLGHREGGVAVCRRIASS